MATIEDFNQLEIRVGTIVAASPLAGARKPALVLTIDFGPAFGIKRSSAQITERYTPERLIGRQVLAVTNLPARRIAGCESEVLTLGVPDQNGAVVLLAPDTTVPNGAKMF